MVLVRDLRLRQACRWFCLFPCPYELVSPILKTGEPSRQTLWAMNVSRMLPIGVLSFQEASNLLDGHRMNSELLIWQDNLLSIAFPQFLCKILIHLSRCVFVAVPVFQPLLIHSVANDDDNFSVTFLVHCCWLTLTLHTIHAHPTWSEPHLSTSSPV